jgi:hypothetical protein
MFNYLRSVCTHIISAVASAIALYSTSVLDLDIVLYFLALQEIKFEPKNTAKPPVDLLLSMLSAQSVSENAQTRVEFDFLIFNPSLEDCFTYLNILLTTAPMNCSRCM